MDGYDENDLSHEMGALSVDDNRWKELGLDENIRTQLSKIENDYESIFSWNIKRLTGANQNLKSNLLDHVRGRLEINTAMNDKDNKFDLKRFHLQLVVSYELYNRKSYKESYLEIKSVVKFLETCKFDKSNKQYSDAYHHIAQATNAYIALTLKIDSEKLLKDVKQIKHFNETEKAAICAVKAIIFMDYPVKGNDIALKFADQACTNSTELGWKVIWLKAKGRVRRYSEPFKMPGNDEIAVANMLCSAKTDPKHLVAAFDLYKEIGLFNTSINNRTESIKFFKLSSCAIKESIELANKDISQLSYRLLGTCKDYSYFVPRSILNDFIAKLASIKNSSVDQTLGLYYLKYEKDYVKAKHYLSLGMAAGNFCSALQYIKVECLLQSVNTFPYVQTLNTMYNDFQDPKRRLIILIHILMYFNYREKNPKEMMHYLKLYIDQDIQDATKKSQLIFASPLFDVGVFLKPNAFLNVLLVNTQESMLDNEWNEKEKKTIENTYNRLNQISEITIEYLRQ